MGRQIESDIANYIYRMNKIKESILSLEGGELLDNHKKALLFNLLETMSKGIYGNEIKRNGEKFKSFILEFCEWDNAERISIQQLSLFLQKTNEMDLVDLKRFIFDKHSKYPKSQPVSFSYDLDMHEMQSLISNDVLYERVKLSYFKHVDLLWKYRNALIHESRSIGADHLFDFENEPHYIHYYQMVGSDKEKMEGHWEIYYPLNFFITLTDNAINNIGPYLNYSKINPFNNHVFDLSWI